jgi:hypothetical protein
MPVVSNSPHEVSPTGASLVVPPPPLPPPASGGVLAGGPLHAAAATSRSQQTRTSTAPYVDDSPRVMTDR